MQLIYICILIYFYLYISIIIQFIMFKGWARPWNLQSSDGWFSRRTFSFAVQPRQRYPFCRKRDPKVERIHQSNLVGSGWNRFFILITFNFFLFSEQVLYLTFILTYFFFEVPNLATCIFRPFSKKYRSSPLSIPGFEPKSSWM